MCTKAWRQERTGGLSRLELSIMCLRNEGGDETGQVTQVSGCEGHVNIL